MYVSPLLCIGSLELRENVILEILARWHDNQASTYLLAANFKITLVLFHEINLRLLYLFFVFYSFMQWISNLLCYYYLVKRVHQMCIIRMLYAHIMHIEYIN